MKKPMLFLILCLSLFIVSCENDPKMPSVRISDGRSSFFQWDLNQTLIVNNANNCDKVHFTNSSRDMALVAEIKTDENGIRYVNVPNSLLTVPLDIEAYLYSSGEQCQLTVCKYVFNVIKRAKPENYVYTEDEHKDFDQLLSEMENNLTEMEKNLELTKQYRDEAKVTDVGTLTDDVNELKGDLDDLAITVESPNIYDGTFEQGYISDGIVVSKTGNYSCTNMIPILRGVHILYVAATEIFGANAYTVFIYDEDGSFIDKIGSTLVDSSKKLYRFIVTEEQYPNAKYFRLNIGSASKPTTFMLVVGNTIDDYPTEYVPHFDPYKKLGETVKLSDSMVKNIEDMIPASDNTLWGKKLAVNGDSICYGAGASGGYAKYIGENNNMTVSNIAVSGGTLASGTTYSGGGNRHWICRTIENMPTDADYYILEGGSNDVALGVPIGNLSSGYTATLDDTTFYGAMESVCKQMITKFKGKKYGFLIVHQMKGGMQITDARYIAIIECCNKWGIPYLDLAKNCVPFGLFEKDWGNDLSSLRNAYTADDGTGYGDGWHPNEECYKKYYVPKIEAWLKTL